VHSLWFKKEEDMLRKLLSVMLSVLLINVAASAAHARSQGDKQSRRIEKIKENVRKLGTGPEARVEVELNDGRNFKGSIREATDDSFVVLEEKTEMAIPVPYSQVVKLKGKNGLTAAKVGINVAKGVGIIAGTAAAFALLMYIFIPRT
jgi:small nuclear ribonucleoprotein (snRNP)-like protein